MSSMDWKYHRIKKNIHSYVIYDDIGAIHTLHMLFYAGYSAKEYQTGDASGRDDRRCHFDIKGSISWMIYTKSPDINYSNERSLDETQRIDASLMTRYGAAIGSINDRIENFVLMRGVNCGQLRDNINNVIEDVKAKVRMVWGEYLPYVKYAVWKEIMNNWSYIDQFGVERRALYCEPEPWSEMDDCLADAYENISFKILNHTPAQEETDQWLANVDQNNWLEPLVEDLAERECARRRESLKKTLLPLVPLAQSVKQRFNDWIENMVEPWATEYGDKPCKPLPMEFGGLPEVFYDLIPSHFLDLDDVRATICGPYDVQQALTPILSDYNDIVEKIDILALNISSMERLTKFLLPWKEKREALEAELEGFRASTMQLWEIIYDVHKHTEYSREVSRRLTLMIEAAENRRYLPARVFPVPGVPPGGPYIRRGKITKFL